MMNSKSEALRLMIEFIQAILSEENSPEFADRLRNVIHDFGKKLNDLNDDASNSETRPFLLITRDKDDVLEENKINDLLLATMDTNLEREFVKVVHEGVPACFFSHKARPFVDQYIEEKDVAYANILSNGIVFNDFQFIGFYTASKERLEAGLVEARHLLSLNG